MGVISLEVCYWYLCLCFRQPLNFAWISTQKLIARNWCVDSSLFIGQGMYLMCVYMRACVCMCLCVCAHVCVYYKCDFRRKHIGHRYRENIIHCTICIVHVWGMISWWAMLARALGLQHSTWGISWSAWSFQQLQLAWSFIFLSWLSQCLCLH